MEVTVEAMTMETLFFFFCGGRGAGQISLLPWWCTFLIHEHNVLSSNKQEWEVLTKVPQHRTPAVCRTSKEGGTWDLSMTPGVCTSGWAEPLIGKCRICWFLVTNPINNWLVRQKKMLWDSDSFLGYKKKKTLFYIAWFFFIPAERTNCHISLELQGCKATIFFRL